MPGRTGPAAKVFLIRMLVMITPDFASPGACIAVKGAAWSKASGSENDFEDRPPPEGV